MKSNCSSSSGSGVGGERGQEMDSMFYDGIKNKMYRGKLYIDR